MPELAEVERAKEDCRKCTDVTRLTSATLTLMVRTCEHKVIQDVLAKEDKIVFAGTTHEQFIKSIRGKRVVRVGRLGKYFYMVLQSSPHILMHLGMSGFVSTKGQEPLFYRKKAKNWKNDDGSDWPLRYWKFALKMDDGAQWCFSDSRRFGRVTLIDSGDKDITEVEPLSTLGRDPHTNMPTLEELSPLLLKRKAPIKAVLLNQNGPFCGLGNWLVDEILFQARIHPAQRSSTLSPEQLAAVHAQTKHVVDTAVSVNADHKQFPATWLFKYRWGKGRRNEPATFELPDGTIATVIHQTVGGRTSAIVEAVQKLVGDVASDDEEGLPTAEDGSIKGEDDEDGPAQFDVKTKRSLAKLSASPPKAKRARKRKIKDSDDGSDLTPAEENTVEETVVKLTKTSKSRRRVAKAEEAPENTAAGTEAIVVQTQRSSRRKSIKAEVDEAQIDDVKPVKRSRRRP